MLVMKKRIEFNLQEKMRVFDSFLSSFLYSSLSPLFFCIRFSLFFVLGSFFFGFQCTALMSVSYYNKQHETRRPLLCINFWFNFDKKNRLLKSKSWEQQIGLVSLQDRKVGLFFNSLTSCGSSIICDHIITIIVHRY